MSGFKATSHQSLPAGPFTAHADITGLTPATKYYVRMVVNDDGTNRHYDMDGTLEGTNYTSWTTAAGQQPAGPTAEFSWAPQPITMDPFTLTRETDCPAAPCTYDWTVTLKVTDANGNTDTVTHNLSASD